jgi:hypothetical protein
MMTAEMYARLAAAIFALIALLQLIRAIQGWPVTLGETTMPLWPSWVAFIVAAALAWMGFAAARH